jgi:hypothetical protein
MVVRRALAAAAAFHTGHFRPSTRTPSTRFQTLSALRGGGDLQVAGTWEGIQAAKALEAEGIRTNITLVFSMAQAVAAAQVTAPLAVTSLRHLVGTRLAAKHGGRSAGERDPHQSVRGPNHGLAQEGDGRGGLLG